MPRRQIGVNSYIYHTLHSGLSDSQKPFGPELA